MTTATLVILAWAPLLAFALAIIPATLAIGGAFDAFGIGRVNNSTAPTSNGK
jgi:hypothetical protein